MFTDLMIPKTLEEYVERRNQTRDRLESLYTQQAKIEDDLEEFGPYLYPSNAKFRNSLDESIRDMDRSFWRRAFDLTGFANILDAKAKREFENSLEGRQCPEFNMPTIEQTFLELYQTKDDMFRRGIVEVFRYLSPTYKTNQKEIFKIPEKIIVEYIIDRMFCAPCIRYEKRQTINDIDRIFKLLDGVKFEQESLLTEIQAQFKESDGKHFENEYFKMKGFKNGNMHLWFKRHDLLEKVNEQVAIYYGENKLAA